MEAADIMEPGKANSRAPIEVKPYNGNHSPEIEFDNNNPQRVYVNQGSVRVSEAGLPLVTEGITRCHPGIIKNIRTGLSAMIHFESLIESDWELEEKVKLLKDGEKRALLFTGTTSVKSGDSKAFLNNLGIPFEEISVDTGEEAWAIAYRPVDDLVLIDNRLDHKLMVYKGF